MLMSRCRTAFGPLILGPLSENFGRARVLQSANMFFFGAPTSVFHRKLPDVLTKTHSVESGMRVCAERSTNHGLPLPLGFRGKRSFGSMCPLALSCAVYLLMISSVWWRRSGRHVEPRRAWQSYRRVLARALARPRHRARGGWLDRRAVDVALGVLVYEYRGGHHRGHILLRAA